MRTYPTRQNPTRPHQPTQPDKPNQTNLFRPDQPYYTNPITNPAWNTQQNSTQRTQPNLTSLSYTTWLIKPTLSEPTYTSLRTWPNIHWVSWSLLGSFGELLGFGLFLVLFDGNFLTGPLKSSWIFLEPVLDENLWIPLPTCVRHFLPGEAFNGSRVWLWCWPSFYRFIRLTWYLQGPKDQTKGLGQEDQYQSS